MLSLEELIQEPAPAAAHDESKVSKKERILELYGQGVTEIDRLAAEVDTRPSYVANVLQDAGLLRGYFDLYTTTNREQNAYSRFFRGVLSFKSVDQPLYARPILRLV